MVDGGSRDRTAERAEAAGARVVIERQRGYGRAIQAGIAAARADADILLFLDGDGSDRPEFIPALIAPIIAGQCGLRPRLARARRARAGQPVRPSRSSPATSAGLLSAPGLWRALHRHVAVSRHPARCARAPRHARDDLWLEPGNADAGRRRRPAGRWRSPSASAAASAASRRSPAIQSPA